MRGQYVEPITDDLKDKFLDLIASGYTRPEAAAALDASARQFRALCNPRAHSYDESFHRQYETLTAPEGEHHTALVERLENAAVERAVRSSDRLLEKLLINKSPEWAIHRPQSMQINFGNVEQLAVVLPELSTETLQQMREEIENKKALRELPAGPPDIDA